jgi:hypothetical protein
MELRHYLLRYGDDSYAYRDPLEWTVKVKDAASNEIIEEEHISKYNGNYDKRSKHPKRYQKERFKFNEIIVASEVTFIFNKIRDHDHASYNRNLEVN